MHAPQPTDSIGLVRADRSRGRHKVHGDAFAPLPRTMGFESLLTYSRTRHSLSLRLAASGSELFAESLDGRVGDAYDEETFQHFLAVERVRAERAERSFFLLLVSLRRCPEMGTEVPRGVSPTLLAGLGLCVREVDFVGWYREWRVAGAVLTQGLDLPDQEAPGRIVARVNRILSERLPRSVAERLRVRVVRLGLNGNA